MAALIAALGSLLIGLFLAGLILLVVVSIRDRLALRRAVSQHIADTAAAGRLASRRIGLVGREVERDEAEWVEVLREHDKERARSRRAIPRRATRG